MITIDERVPSKVPGATALFISFPYNKDVVATIKAINCVKNYDAKTFTWELPSTELSKVIDRCCRLDDITLNLLATKDEKPKTYKLGKFKTEPFDYQKDAIQYGLNHPCWLLLDAPGLGKTLSMICLAQELKEREKLKHCLVICGVNALKFNWKSEIQKHSDLSVRILGERTTKRGKIKIGSVADRLEDLKNPIEEFFVITNIETLRDKKIIKELTKKNPKNTFDMIVTDECHMMKNSESEQGAHFLKLTKAKYRIGLTGTILTNSPMDAYVPLQWIGADVSTLTNFKYHYCEFGGAFGNELIGYKNIDSLKEQLASVSLRRTKDVLNLPPKTIITEYVEMEDRQKKFYNDIVEGELQDIDKVTIKKNATLLAIIVRLRQATESPQTLTTENVPSAKVERAVQLAEEIISNGEKVVIFSVFKDAVKELETRLAKYNPLLCTGDVKDSVIAERRELFQNDDKYKVLLGTTQKVGTGFTFTKASYSIFLSTPWTYANFEQAQDRIYRIGQDNPVFCYNLVTKDTVDERVLEIVNSKKAVSEFVVDDKVENQEALDILRRYIIQERENLFGG